jgi:hypothetical protein
MGAQQSASPQGVVVGNYVKIFGPPCGVCSRNKMVVWTSEKLSRRTLYGKKICFSRILLKLNEPEHLWVYMNIDLSDAKVTSMNPVTSKFMYDKPNKTLIVKSSSLPEAIVISRVLTDVATDKLTAESGPAAIQKGLQDLLVDRKLNEAAVKEEYVKLCENLTKPAERFMSDPWYSVNNPYASNQPLDVALAENDNYDYYTILDEMYEQKKAADSVFAFPRAPTAKPSVENFLNVPQLKKVAERATDKNPRCTGPCAERYAKTLALTSKSETLQNPDQLVIKALGPARNPERMINYDAYTKLYDKPTYLNAKPGQKKTLL